MLAIARVAVFETGIFFDEAHPHITGFTVAELGHIDHGQIVGIPIIAMFVVAENYFY